MDKYLIPFIIALIVIVSVGALIAVVTSDDRTISVSGSGSVTVSPDICQINLMAKNTGTDIKTIQEINTELVNNLITALKEDHGLTDDEITTAGYTISDYYFTTSGRTQFAGKKAYQVVQTLVIETDQISDVGKIIDTAAARGAYINSLTFSLSPEKEHEYRAEALNAAVQSAYTDASITCTEMGSILGSPKTVSVQQSYYPIYADSYKSPSPEMVSVNDEGSTQVSPGEVNVNAYVSIQYAIC